MESLITVHHNEANKLAEMLQAKGIPYGTKSLDMEYEFLVNRSDLRKAEHVTYLLFGE